MNAILLINIKNPARPGRDDVYGLSIESWKRWAQNNNAEVLVLDEPVVPVERMTPIIQRHYVFDLVDLNYDQVLMVDADTIVHPNCPDFFQLTDDRYSAVHNDGDYDWIIRSIENYQYEFPAEFTKQFNIWKYINTGFMITNSSYKEFHKAVIDFYWKHESKIREVQGKYGVGTDQPLVNLIANEMNMEINILSYQFNMQDLPRKNILDKRMLFTNIPGVYHFNAIAGGPGQANYWIEKTFNYFYK